MKDAAANKTASVALAIILVVLTGFTLAGMDALGKTLMDSYSMIQVVWARYFFHTLAVLAWLHLSGKRDYLYTGRPFMQFIRGLCLMLITLAMYSAYRHVSLADATTVMFFGPVLVSVFAGIFLGEKVGRARLIAAFTGFAGVVVIVNPGGELFHPAIFFACVAAVSYAIYVLLTRLLQTTDYENATQFYSTVLGSIILSVMVIPGWQSIPLTLWPLFITMGIMGAAGHFILIRAFQLAPASLLSPFLNAQLVAASLFSTIIFADPLHLNFYIGALLVVGSGLAVWLFEIRKASQALSRNPG